MMITYQYEQLENVVIFMLLFILAAITAITIMALYEFKKASDELKETNDLKKYLSEEVTKLNAEVEKLKGELNEAMRYRCIP